MLTPSAAAAPDLDPAAFITANLALGPVRAVPEVVLYAAHSSSGLHRLAPDDADAPAPYWAFAWGGGLALARHILDHPPTVAGRRVLDLGSGSGLVAIAAAKAGAAEVTAAEIDFFGSAAISLNAAANGVAIRIIGSDITAGPPPAVDLVLAGDTFYAEHVAARVLPFLERCRDAGIDVLVGDPGRSFLPLNRLRLIAEYRVGDVGEAARAGSVFEWLQRA